MSVSLPEKACATSVSLEGDMPAPVSTLHCPLGCAVRDLLVDWTQWSQKCLVAATYAMIVRKRARLVLFLAIGIFLHMRVASARAQARADAESTAPNAPVHPYLGESPPGTVPKPFAPGILSLLLLRRGLLVG